jgi:epsilon-lactone hydrolase
MTISWQAKGILWAQQTFLKWNTSHPGFILRGLRAVMHQSPILVTKVRAGLALNTQRPSGFQGDWITHTDPGSAKHHLLYLHGGGYIAGRPAFYRSPVMRLAELLSANAVVPDYPLAPEHPFPAGLDSAVAAYQRMLDGGAPPQHVVVMGDSAGAGMTAALLLRLKQLDLPQPAAAVLFSPYANMLCTNASLRTNEPTDGMFTYKAVAAAMPMYYQKGRPAQSFGVACFWRFFRVCAYANLGVQSRVSA